MEKDTRDAGSKSQLDEASLFEDVDRRYTELKDSINIAMQKLQEERQRLQQERSSFEKLTGKLEKVQFSSPVRLNVGGKYFMTSLETLQKDPTSFFGAMFSGSWKAELGEDGAYFIDRDPKYFRVILNYLRYGELVPPAKEPALTELKKEVEFYQLSGLLEQLDKRAFEECTLANEQQQQKLVEWANSGDKKWRLVYRASRDGFQPDQFHDKCDNIGETITLLRSTQGFVFGGYAAVSWHTNGWDPKAFIFTLSNPHNLQPTMFRNTEASNNIFGHRSYGPTFGRGHDIYVRNQKCTFGFPNGFVDPTGFGIGTFTGSSACQLDEIEVFAVGEQ